MHIVKLPALSALEQTLGMSVKTPCKGLCFSIKTTYFETITLLLLPDATSKLAAEAVL